ncbi:TetR/AcrR family transcriptional regulator [Kribbella solani]|uniref:TetR/AcrR family transcriptional regulator n=1 Tax=Kribbella solani TaxID=236067 RepID=UPI0029A68752|nr:TetR/AcrR family transcriptional regulator [Kribbella solani]MDX2971372.1 TetR/AcrR family transcriptional regulator [Kribbella solani]MDX3005452.1 TetR/AcrR family transcriptional regulator [Kribbella solani]
MDAGTTRSRNRRGQGELLRREIIDAALRMLNELGDDEALSLRAVAREVGIAATSVYIHFADRDALVFAALEQCTAGLLRDLEAAEAQGGADPVRRLRARLLFLGSWTREYAGLYKVLHESTLNRRMKLVFKAELAVRAIAAVQACMDAGLVPVDDAAAVALDLRSAVHGAVSIRINEPEAELPPLEVQVDRFLRRLVGVPIEHVF